MNPVFVAASILFTSRGILMAEQRSELQQAAAPAGIGEEDVPAAFRPIYADLVRLLDKFCSERLDAEFQQLCRRMAAALCQEGSPVVRGKREGWACGIVFTVGAANFLQDPSFEPHVRSEEIAKWFGVSAATMHSKAKVLREGLDIVPLEPQWTVPSRLRDNPFAWLVEMRDGMLVDTRMLPASEQKKLVEAGVIPFVYKQRENEPDTRLLAPLPMGLVESVLGGGELSEEELQEWVRDALAPITVYQIKVTLNDVKPAVWRRLRVPDVTLDQLHEFVQVAFGWLDCHLHEFSVGEERIVSDDAAEFEEIGNEVRFESEVSLGNLIEAGMKQFEYAYDFGDDWRHTIKIEKTLQIGPDDEPLACLAGSGACPPEDCGGPWGYAALLEALADPKHERHKELIEWLPDEFDPNHFSVEEVNQDFDSLFDDDLVDEFDDEV